MCAAKRRVCFTPESGHVQCTRGCPLSSLGLFGAPLSIDRTNSATLRSRRAEACLHRGASMKIAEALLASVMVCATLATTATAADAPPRWAYPENNPNYKPPVDDGNLVRVPDSTAGYTWTQLRDRFIAPIWHPGDHAPLPDIVANGRKPDVFACGFCHRADGPGGPGKRRPRRPSEELHHPADGRLQERRARHRRPRSLATDPDDRSFQADHRCRGGSGGGLFLRPAAAQAHQGGRKRHRAENLHRRSALGSGGGQ